MPQAHRKKRSLPSFDSIVMPVGNGKPIRKAAGAISRMQVAMRIA